jgi:hypothetical protein
LTTVRTPTDLRRGFQRFLADRYPNAKTVTRYLNAWSALATFLEHRKIISPAQVTYQLCIDYPQFRTNAPKELMRSRSWEYGTHRAESLLGDSAGSRPPQLHHCEPLRPPWSETHSR